MVSLATLVTWKGEKPLGGVVGLSGLQGLDEPEGLNLDVIRKIPLFSYHGKDDTVLKFENAETSFGFLRNNIYSGEHSKNYTYNSEAGVPHSVSPKEQGLVRDWMTARCKEIDNKNKVEKVKKEEEKKASAKPAVLE